MLPAIMKNKLDDFSEANEKVFYSIFNNKEFIKDTGTEWFFHLKNTSGKIIDVVANTDIFKLYRIK